MHGFEWSTAVLGCIWIVSVALLTAGLWTRPAAVVNYVFTIAVIGSFRSYECHIDYIYAGVSFLCIFLPVSNALSLDNRRLGLPKRSVPASAYFVLLFYAPGLVYFDSAFHKLAQSMWREGLGVWLPCSYPHTTFLDLTPLLNLEFVVKLLSWTTLLLELSFIFAFWHRRLRLPLLLIGVGLHLGILLSFPIPWFALAMLALYIPLGAVTMFGARPGASLPSGKSVGPVEHWNVAFGRGVTESTQVKAIFYGILICCGLQLSALLRAPSVAPGLHQLLPLRVSNFVLKTSVAIDAVSKPLFGITAHSIFLDYHFDGYRHIVALVHRDDDGNERWLPIIRKSGQVGIYNTGRIWGKWTFRVNSPQIDQARLMTGIEDFIRFWARRNGLPLDRGEYLVRVKKLDAPSGWERDFLSRQLAKPWLSAGVVRCASRGCTFQLEPIEQL